MGAWFEACIVKISAATNRPSDDSLQLRQPLSSCDAVSDQRVTADDRIGDANANDMSLVTDDASDDGFLYSIVFERSVCGHLSTVVSFQMNGKHKHDQWVMFVFSIHLKTGRASDLENMFQ